MRVMASLGDELCAFHCDSPLFGISDEHPSKCYNRQFNLSQLTKKFVNFKLNEMKEDCETIPVS